MTVNGQLLIICPPDDEGDVEPIAKRLRDQLGLAIWFAPWDAMPGEPLQEQLERVLTAAAACAIFLRAAPRDGWFHEQLRAAIQRRVEDQPAFRIIPALLPGAAPDLRGTLPPFLRRYPAVAIAAPDDERALRLIAAGALGRRPADVGARLVGPSGSPQLPTDGGQPAGAQLTLRVSAIDRGRATITWESAVLGQRESAFTSPFDLATLPLVIRALDLAQHPASAPGLGAQEVELLTSLGLITEWPTSGLHARVGRGLFDALVADPEGAVALRTFRDSAAASRSAPSFLWRFPPTAASFAALPWELTWGPSGPLLVSQGGLASCVRYLDLGQAVPSIPEPSAPFHILALAPHAGIDEATLASDERMMEAVWAEQIQRGAVTLERLSPVTPQRLVDRVQAGPRVDLLHFVGHGSSIGGRGKLLLDGPQGGTQLIEAERLAALLGGVRLVVLLACRSSRSDSELLTGIAPALSAAGIPAVVAMQLSVRAVAATRFAEVLYRSLARANSLQRSVSLARQALFIEEPDQASWYVPTLTIRAPDTGPVMLFGPAR